MTYPVQEKPEWRNWMTSKTLHVRPIHRWFVFPHSFTAEFVHALIDDWGLNFDDHILDPFVGAGTTLLSAKEKGIPASGYDLSPLAVLTSRVKIANYGEQRLRGLWSGLDRRIDPATWNAAKGAYPHLVREALPGKLLGAFEAIDRAIDGLNATSIERDFFRLALLSTIPKYSRAVAEGGWLKWVVRRNSSSTLAASFRQRVCMMLDDLTRAESPGTESWRIGQADARSLPDSEASYSAVITSPPYPNRHDYTRVFGVELMFGFLDWEQTRQLRYQSFHSHPEGRPTRPLADEYLQPKRLNRILVKLRKKEEDVRIIEMLAAYFLDLYLVLREAGRICKPKARAALVVGNAQYRGVPVPVDELTAEIGEQVGLACDKLFIARYRGNSAQQMGTYGRKPSRETVVIFRKP